MIGTPNPPTGIGGSMAHTAIRAAKTPARATWAGTASGLRPATETDWLTVDSLEAADGGADRGADWRASRFGRRR
ncbi:hypothetical protein ACFFX0_00090 [Citricoccus parietis]|uniref:Uncharacterized protein n=1 Tax=Citricoccus parietis TaxID=592307 RepID=A0ABV5FSP0_9MICC